SIGRGKSCQSPAAIGQPQVTQSEDWYYSRRSVSMCRRRLLARADEVSGGDQVNDEIELGRLLDWQVARLRAAHDFVDIITDAPEQVLRQHEQCANGEHRSVTLSASGLLRLRCHWGFARDHRELRGGDLERLPSLSVPLIVGRDHLVGERA